MLQNRVRFSVVIFFCFLFFWGGTDFILSVFEMALTDYANKIFKLIESHQKSAGLAKLNLKNVKEWLS